METLPVGVGISLSFPPCQNTILLLPIDAFPPHRDGRIDNGRVLRLLIQLLHGSVQRRAIACMRSTHFGRVQQLLGRTTGGGERGRPLLLDRLPERDTSPLPASGRERNRHPARQPALCFRSGGKALCSIAPPRQRDADNPFPALCLGLGHCPPIFPPNRHPRAGPHRPSAPEMLPRAVGVVCQQPPHPHPF